MRDLSELVTLDELPPSYSPLPSPLPTETIQPKQSKPLLPPKRSAPYSLPPPLPRPFKPKPITNTLEPVPLSELVSHSLQLSNV